MSDYKPSLHAPYCPMVVVDVLAELRLGASILMMGPTPTTLRTTNLSRCLPARHYSHVLVLLKPLSDVLPNL